MRRAALIAVAVAILFTPNPRPTKALPEGGIDRYYYANTCDPLYRYGPGQVGQYLGVRSINCTGSYNTIAESDLVGYDNWKQEIAYDCPSGGGTETWYHGGYGQWTAVDPQECVYYQ
jgi:hypothetical protein